MTSDVEVSGPHNQIDAELKNVIKYLENEGKHKLASDLKKFEKSQANVRF